MTSSYYSQSDPQSNHQGKQHILQVSELTKKVRFMLEGEFNRVWLCGEISNFVAASSGHWYLSLKDSKSQVRCAMFKGSNSRVRLSPKNGQQVLVRAKVSLYEPRGDFQLIIEQMEDAGEGLLRQQFEQLKQKLNAQGLFSTSIKKTIPKHIQTVGIVTSPTGAAVKDILTVLKRRNANIQAIIYPALVQGQHAASDIAAAIQLANTRQECEVLIIGRGGGSLEDLWSFNEEVVVQAIYHSQIAIISAVGHEIDTTLADFAADLRAPTPSAAAELVSQDSDELRQKIQQFNHRLKQCIKQKLMIANSSLSTNQHRLSQNHPVQQLQYQQQKSDELTHRLKLAMHRALGQLKSQPQQLEQRLQNAAPHHQIQQQLEKVNTLKQRLIRSRLQDQQYKTEAFKHLIEQLHLISPLATIARGYSVVRNENKQVINSIAQVSIDDEISLQMADGLIQAKVLNKKLKT